jgi:hypothetical protein
MAKPKVDNVDVENTMPEIAEANTPVVETPVVSTPASLPATEANANRRIQIKETQRRALVKRYLSEKKIPVTISPLYAPYLGKVVPVLVNGIRVDIPADGRTYQINETHASEIIAKIRRINDLLARQKKAGDVSNNVERNIGELKF